MFSKRPVNISCLTESAAANTAPLNFEDYAILCNLNKRNNRIFNIWSIIHIDHQLLCNGGRNTRGIWFKFCNRAILMVGHIVKHGDVNTRQLGCSLQECPAVSAVIPNLLIQIKEIVILSLSLSDVEHIKERGQRLRIVGAGTASDYNGIIFLSVLCMKRNSA